MTRASESANSVVAAVEEACEVWGVPVYRMQSRVFTVTGKGGKNRPMFVGKWKDGLGVWHTKGMADMLAHPTIHLMVGIDDRHREVFRSVPFPLWIEAKFGSGKQGESAAREAKCICGQPINHQKHFQEYVESKGASYIVAQDCADAVIEWFKRNGVTR